MSSQEISRREFIRYVSLATAGFGLQGLVNSPQANAAPEGYRALVYIFLFGGNDSFNTLVPLGDGPLRQRYESARRVVALPQDALHALNVRGSVRIESGETHNEFGLHPDCPDLAALFNNQELSFICNVGNLRAPTTQQDYRDRRLLPPELFSHDGQQRQYQSEPQARLTAGWGGALAEALSSDNTDSSLSPLISTSGLNVFQVSQSNALNTFVLGRDGIVQLRNHRGAQRNMIETIMNDDQGHLIANKYRDTFLSASLSSERVASAFSIAEDSGVDYDGVFASAGAAESDIGRQLKTVAKMIGGAEASTNRRPVFFIGMGGFDHHQNLLADHSEKMMELNAALKAFRDVLVASDDFNSVLTLVGSEFSRTFTPNGDDGGAGTDHAWGGHCMAMGGMVRGGRLFGRHPDLVVGGPQDVDSNTRARGRWIPTTSATQVAGVASRWMGAPSSALTELFPSLANFPSPFGEAANISFIEGVDLP